MSNAPPDASEPVPACAPHMASLQRQMRKMSALPQAPWLHEEVARRLAAKLTPIRMEPRDWIDWSAFMGAGADLVQARYPQAQRWVVEPSQALARRSQALLSMQARRDWRKFWRRDVPQAYVEPTPDDVPWRADGADGAQMLWANMTLHATTNLPELMHCWHQHLGDWS